MDHEITPAPSLRSVLPSWSEALVLVLFTASITYAAWLVRPTWDDGWIQLLHARGLSLQQALTDRPIYAAFFGLLERNGSIWSFHLGMHFFGWLAQGVAALVVWSVFFPTRPQYRLAVALMAVAPVICQYQAMVVGGTIYLVQVAAAYFGFAAVYWMQTSAASVLRKSIVAVVAGLFVFGNSLVSEYTVPAAVAAGVLLYFSPASRAVSSRSRRLLAAFLPSAAIIGYAVYHLTANAATRPDVRPEVVLSGIGDFISFFAVTAATLLTDLWQLVIGRTLTAAGSLRVPRGPHALAICLFTLGAAAAVTWASLGMAKRRHVTSVAQNDWRHALLLLVSIAVALCPIVVMGRFGASYKMDTRFWLPVLPLAACLSVYWIALVAAERFTTATIGLLGLFLGFVTATTSYRDLDIVAQTRSWGARLHRVLSPEGNNAAIFTYEAPDVLKAGLVSERSYELTGRLTSEWPTQDRNRFWAFAGPWAGYEVPDPPAELNITVRSGLRSGPIKKYFWLSIGEDGQLRRVLQRTPPATEWVSAPF